MLVNIWSKSSLQLNLLDPLLTNFLDLFAVNVEFFIIYDQMLVNSWSKSSLQLELLDPLLTNILDFFAVNVDLFFL